MRTITGRAVAHRDHWRAEVECDLTALPVVAEARTFGHVETVELSPDVSGRLRRVDGKDFSELEGQPIAVDFDDGLRWDCFVDADGWVTPLSNRGFYRPSQ